MSTGANPSRRRPRSRSHEPLTLGPVTDLSFAGPEVTSCQDVDIMPLYDALIADTNCAISFAAPPGTPNDTAHINDVRAAVSGAMLTFVVNAVTDENFRYLNQQHAIKALTTFYTNTGGTRTISPTADGAVADMADWIRTMDVGSRRGCIEAYFVKRALAEPGTRGGDDDERWEQDWEEVPDPSVVRERGWEKDWEDANSERGSVARSEWEECREEGFAKIGNGLNVHEEQTRQARLNVERRRAGRKAETSKSRSDKLALGAITLLTALGLGAAAYHFCSRSGDTYTD